MTKTQAEAFRIVLESAGVGSHLEETVRNHNGWSLIVGDKVRLSQVEQAQRFVNSIGDRKKANA